MDIHVEGTPGISSYSYICSNVNPLQIDILDLIEALIIILTEAVKYIFLQSFFKAKIAFIFVYKCKKFRPESFASGEQSRGLP